MIVNKLIILIVTGRLHGSCGVYDNGRYTPGSASPTAVFSVPSIHYQKWGAASRQKVGTDANVAVIAASRLPAAEASVV